MFEKWQFIDKTDFDYIAVFEYGLAWFKKQIDVQTT
jgi:hypothetical protein